MGTGAGVGPRMTGAGHRLERLNAAVPLVVLAAWATQLPRIELGSMNDLGLVSVLPVSIWALLGVLTVSFALSLGQAPVRPWVAALHVVALMVMLFAITALIEVEPRFSSTYRHAGLVNHFQVGRAVDPDIDAYFSWPGFFALGAAINQVTGLGSALSIAAWSPLFLNLLYLAPLIAILRWATDDERVVWLGAWIFASLNWVGQDYYSPQGVAFGGWLCLLVVLLRWGTLRSPAYSESLSPRALARAVFARSIVRGSTREVERPVMASGLLAVVLIAHLAIVAGHQLTPMVVVLTVGGLVAFAGMQPRRLPIVMGVLLTAWISYMTTRYLAGHFGTLLKPVGQVGSNFEQSISSRIVGSSDHLWVVSFRTRTSAIAWLLAAIGFARRARSGHLEVAFLVIGAGPFVLPVLQPYGGEILLRVFLFVLPIVAFSIASLVYPSPTHGRGLRSTVAVVALGWVLLATFQVTRYGNERQDHFTPDDARTIEAMYRLVPEGAAILAGNDNLPWRAVHYADYRYDLLTETATWAGDGDPAGMLEDIRTFYADTGAYVVITRSTHVYAGLFFGRPEVLHQFVDVLEADPEVQSLYRVGEAAIFFVPPAADR